MKNVPNLRFKEFSGEWENKKIGEITIKVGSGKTPKGGNSVYTDEGVIFLRSQNVLNGKLSLNDVAYITDDINSTMKSTEVYPNDILLNITGASIGRSCCVPEGFGKANVNQHVCIIRLNEKYNPNFIMNQIISSKIQKQIDSFQAGGNREGLNFEQIKGMKIGSTSIEEQEKIASFFSLIDKKIELQTEKVEELKNYKKGIMQKMFPKKGETVPELRFAGFTNAWEQRKFSEIAEIRRGLTYKPADVRDVGVRVLRSSNINEDTFVLKSDDVFVRAEAANIDFVENGDILITSANGSSRLVGKHALISGINDNTVHGGFMLLARANRPQFVNALMSSNWYDKFIHVFVSGGNGAIGNLSKSDLESQTVFVPNDEEQKKIGEFFASIDNLITLHQCKLDALNEYKKGLLQQMFI